MSGELSFLQRIVLLVLNITVFLVMICFYAIIYTIFFTGTLQLIGYVPNIDIIWPLCFGMGASSAFKKYRVDFHPFFT